MYLFALLFVNCVLAGIIPPVLKKIKFTKDQQLAASAAGGGVLGVTLGGVGASVVAGATKDKALKDAHYQGFKEGAKATNAFLDKIAETSAKDAADKIAPMLPAGTGFFPGVKGAVANAIAGVVIKIKGDVSQKVIEGYEKNGGKVLKEGETLVKEVAGKGLKI